MSKLNFQPSRKVFLLHREGEIPIDLEQQKSVLSYQGKTMKAIVYKSTGISPNGPMGLNVY